APPSRPGVPLLLPGPVSRPLPGPVSRLSFPGRCPGVPPLLPAPMSCCGNDYKLVSWGVTTTTNAIGRRPVPAATSVPRATVTPGVGRPPAPGPSLVHPGPPVLPGGVPCPGPPVPPETSLCPTYSCRTNRINRALAMIFLAVIMQLV